MNQPEWITTCYIDENQKAHRVPRQTGVPSEDWPEGAWHNGRTYEIVLRSNTFAPPLGTQPTLQRGYQGTSEVEALPDDVWYQIGPAGMDREVQRLRNEACTEAALNAPRIAAELRQD